MGAGPGVVERLQGEAFRPYSPRLALEWIRDEPGVRRRAVDGSLVMADVSGFTALSERLAAKGREGAEELTDLISHTFSDLLAHAYRVGGNLLKFGGDALLLWFEGEGHPVRACHAAGAMRSALRSMGAISTSVGPVRLRMSVGVHSGTTHLFLAGGSHRELIVTGPAVTETLHMESAAEGGTIVVSPTTAGLLPRRLLGTTFGPGVLLSRIPDLDVEDSFPEAPSAPDSHLLLSPPVREVAEQDSDDAEHRQVTIAFLRFSGVDARICAGRLATVEAQLERLVSVVQDAASRHEVCFLGSDVLADGGKILLTAGAPRTTADDDARMLLTLREVFDGYRGVTIAAGVDRGHVFSGSIGPRYRRTYTVMGDTVNTAARVMSKAGPGKVLASRRVLDRSATAFESVELAPLSVKGKSEPVLTAEVGAPIGLRLRPGPHFPMVGRQKEIDLLREAWEEVSSRRGRVVSISGEAGIGKTRLLEELRTFVSGAVHSAVAHPHAALTPYHVLGQLMRSAMGAEEHVTPARLRRVVSEHAQELEPLLPLLGDVLGITIAATPQTQRLDPSFRKRLIERTASTFLARLCPGPTLWLMDDLDAADSASRDAIHVLANGVDDRPWLIVVAGRTDMVVANSSVSLPLEPLTQDEALRLAVEAAGGALLPDDARMLASRSGGHPLFLIELAPIAVEGGELPSSLETVVAESIDQLRSSERALLRRLAVLGREGDVELIAALADRTAPDAVDRLSGFIEAEGSVFRFRRALYQEVAYAGLPYKARRDLHARIGVLLEERGGRPDELSLHFSVARDHQRTWTYASEAAHAARLRSAHAEAIELYRRALAASRVLDLPGAVVSEAWLELGNALQWSGRLQEAVEAYRAGRRHASDPAATVLLYQREGVIRSQLGQAPRALQLFARGLRVLDDARIVEGRWRLTAAYGTVRRRQGRYSDAEKWGHQAVQDAEASGERAGLGHAHNLLYTIYSDTNDPRAQQHGELALELFEGEGLSAFAATVLNNIATERHRGGDWDGALQAWERSREALEETGNVLGAAAVAGNMAGLLSDRGHWDDARTAYEQVLVTFRGAGHPSFVAWAKRNLAQVATRSGRLEEAERVLRELLAECLDGPEATVVRSYLAEALVHTGRSGEAAELARSALEDADPSHRPLILRTLGFAALQRAETEEARRLLTASLEAAGEIDAPYEIALSHQALGVVDGGASEHSRMAEETFRRLGVRATPDVPVLRFSGAPARRNVRT